MINQVVECYLRCYMNDEQNDWADLFGSAEFAINGSINTTTDMAPFQVVHTYDPKINAQATWKDNPSHDSRGESPDTVNITIGSIGISNTPLETRCCCLHETSRCAK